MKTKLVKARYLKVGDIIVATNEMGRLREPRTILDKKKSSRHFSRGTAYDFYLTGYQGRMYALGEDLYEKVTSR